MSLNRRSFLKTAGGLAALTLVPRRVLGGKGYIAPSDQLTKGIIGVGGMGREHIKYEGTRLVAVCDVDTKHIDAAVKMAPDRIKTYEHFMDLTQDPNVDIAYATHRIGTASCP